MKNGKKHFIFFDALRINIFTFLTLIFLWAIIDSIDLFNPFNEFFNNFDYTDLYYSEFMKDEMPRITSYNVCYTKLLRNMSRCGSVSS